MKRHQNNFDRLTDAFSCWMFSAAGEKIVTSVGIVIMTLTVLFLTYHVIRATWHFGSLVWF